MQLCSNAGQYPSTCWRRMKDGTFTYKVIVLWVNRLPTSHVQGHRGWEQTSDLFMLAMNKLKYLTGSPFCEYIYIYISLSLGDIQFMPTWSVFTFFQTFLNFWSNAPKCRHLGGGGGMCMLFEICEKTPFQKCMGWGGIGDHIFEYRGRTFRRFRVCRPQAAPLTRGGHQLTGLPLGALTYCGVGAK